jgi:hypothetical protein
LSCPRPAAAQYGDGSWTFSSTVDSSSDAPGTGSSTLGAYKSIEIGPDGTASVNISPQGQARITAFWSPPSGASGMLPPKTVTVRFSSWIEASGSQGTTYYQSSSGEYFPQTVTLSDAQLDNGFGDPVIVVDDYKGDSSQLGSKRWQVSGLYLKTFSTEGISPPDATRSTWKLVLPATKVSATLTAKASGYHSSGYTVGSIFARIYGFGSVTGDSRSVQIGRARSGNPLRPANDPDLDPKIDDWLEADGTMHGHTRYSYDESTGPGNPIFRPNKQNFTASHSGPWGTWLDYSWSPTGGLPDDPTDDDTISSSTQYMPRGSLYKNAHGDWKGSASSPTTLMVTYSLQDMGGADGAKATAKYYLMLHDQFEEIPGTHNVNHLFTNPRRLGGPILGPGNPGGSKTAEVGYSMGVTFSGAPAKWMADVLGISVEGTYTDTTSVTQTVTGPLLANDEFTYLQALDHYEIHSGTVNEFDNLGFAGRSAYQINAVPTRAEDRVGLRIEQPYIKYQIGGGGTTSSFGS